MKKLLFGLITISSIISCSSDRDDNVPVVDPSATVAIHEVADLDANGDTFTLYNLRENKVVSTDKMDSDAWDIGFQKTKIIVNGGKERAGKGAAAIADKLFEEVLEAPVDDAFKVDNGDVNPDLAIPTGSGKGWYTYTGPPNHTIIPTAGKTIVIKTADSKHYAKIVIQSYYKGAPKDPGAMNPDSGYYNFKYAIQKDGTKVFAK